MGDGFGQFDRTGSVAVEPVLDDAHTVASLAQHRGNATLAGVGLAGLVDTAQDRAVDRDRRLLRSSAQRPQHLFA